MLDKAKQLPGLSTGMSETIFIAGTLFDDEVPLMQRVKFLSGNTVAVQHCIRLGFDQSHRDSGVVVHPDAPNADHHHGHLVRARRYLQRTRGAAVCPSEVPCAP